MKVEKRRVKKVAYVKREKYLPNPNTDVLEEMLSTLIENGVASKKARQLVYYPVPMSLIRWSNYLNPQQIKDFLLPEKKIKESVDVDEVDEFEYDLGI